jgi:hypothetical protein
MSFQEVNDITDLGPCCVCEGTAGVTNIMMLDQRGPVPGEGWGCFQCDLPCDGAVAVVCDDCLGRPLRFVVKGYLNRRERMPIETLPQASFGHDRSKHPEMQQ